MPFAYCPRPKPAPIPVLDLAIVGVGMALMLAFHLAIWVGGIITLASLFGALS